MLAIGACATKDNERYAVAPAFSPMKVQTDIRSISVSEVSLPSYAKESGIFVEDGSGAVLRVPNADWADDTERAMRLALIRHLASLSGAEVAPDPWPLGGVPEAEVRLVVEQMLVDRTDTMRLSGQFSIRRDVATSRSQIRQFEISTKARSRSPADVVDVHRQAWQELAETIAKAL
jgi:uncharacterized lipoprotein YmbA